MWSSFLLLFSLPLTLSDSPTSTSSPSSSSSDSTSSISTAVFPFISTSSLSYPPFNSSSTISTAVLSSAASPSSTTSDSSSSTAFISSTPTSPSSSSITNTPSSLSTTTSSLSTSASSTLISSTTDLVESLLSSHSNVSFIDNEETANSRETAIPLQIRQCLCSEVQQCKLSAHTQVQNCFNKCDSELIMLGNETESYVDCFEKDKDGFTQAEQCLEDTLGGLCVPGNETVYMASFEFGNYLNTTFILNTQPAKHFPLKHKAHLALATFHHFFHCAKHCVHKRMVKCFAEKECSIRLPPLASFSTAMSSCARINSRATRSLRSACLCLLHKKKIRHLAGSCALMGNSHFVKTF